MESLELKDFWQGKRVLITGHTGFKGSWLSEMLLMRGAFVYGLSLEPESQPNLFTQLELAKRLDHLVCDITESKPVKNRIIEVNPDIIFHLAAQPLVLRSYRQPILTWLTNVMGTANVMEGVKALKKQCSIVIVTTDKVYEDNSTIKAYVESDKLGGHDPYSASKAASELIVDSWRKSFFYNSDIRVATARAGNVIGGGDWSENRLIPDLARAFQSGAALTVRRKNSVRPWQHVLEPLEGYLTLAQSLSTELTQNLEMAFNFGPHSKNNNSVYEVVKEALKYWNGNITESEEEVDFHESTHLSICSERSKNLLGWEPRWNFSQSIKETITWYRKAAEGADPKDLTKSQIEKYWRSI